MLNGEDVEVGRKVRPPSLNRDGGAKEPEVVDPSCQEKLLSDDV